MVEEGYFNGTLVLIYNKVVSVAINLSISSRVLYLENEKRTVTMFEGF
jgi:hypothetical protein